MRKHLFFIIAFLFFFGELFGIPKDNKELSLWYTTPAQIWEETLPLGNGRLGAMPDGDVFQEKIVLNEISLWSGSEENAVNKKALAALPKIRSLLLEDKNVEAQDLMYQNFTYNDRRVGAGNSANNPFGCFQTLGELIIDYKYNNVNSSRPAFANYERGLSIANAISYTHFFIGDVKFEREYFVSHANDAIIVKLTASKPLVTFTMSLSRKEKAIVNVLNKTLSMKGQLNNGIDGKGMKFAVDVRIVNKDGDLSFSDQSITVSNSSEVYLIVSGGTDFNHPDFETEVKRILSVVENEKYAILKRNHIRKYKDKFDRVMLKLGKSTTSHLPTNERIVRFQEVDDPSLCALYFQYGRYLMISGTRENSLPLNLQGLWANQTQTQWNGDYHLNINLQMNYWPMEVGNLSELHSPLTNLVKNMVSSGERTAKGFYGAKGWVAHMKTNPWKFTAPGEKASWGSTNTGGAWLCAHLWEHFAFTCDTAYLKEIYPIMKGAAHFFQSSLIEETSNKWLVTAPSSSPENAFIVYKKGIRKAVNVCMGPTMDTQILIELFNNTISAANILSIDQTFQDSLRHILHRLPPLMVSPRTGIIQEWLKDYEESDPQHRHISQLYGLHPSNLITASKTPHLMEACRKTLERRGDGGTGWSMAWKINFWARIYDGEKSYQLIKNLLRPAIYNGKRRGGTFPNLFCAHPPLQIDGNLGGCAGIAEMLIQSHDGYVDIIPALPSSWSSGKFKGLKVRGGGVVDAEWENKRLVKLKIYSPLGNTFKIKEPDGNIREVKIVAGKSRTLSW